jgi:hypothetical protein
MDDAAFTQLRKVTLQPVIFNRFYSFFPSQFCPNEYRGHEYRGQNNIKLTEGISGQEQH